MAVAAIFDIDGTLVALRFDVKGTRKALIEELARYGYSTSGLDLATPTQKILDAAKAQTLPEDDARYEKLRESVFAILDKFEMESVLSTSPFPGTRETLDHLKSRGIRIAVLTNSGKKAALGALRIAGLLDCFEFVLTRDDTVLMKPRPEGLIMAVSRMGVPKESVYYVGDSPFDIDAARDAGIRMVSVATGNYSVEMLKSEGADFAISSITELRRLLGA